MLMGKCHVRQRFIHTLPYDSGGLLKLHGQQLSYRVNPYSR